VLRSGSTDDENSFEHPELVAPRVTALRNLANPFDYTCPPHSLSILRLKTMR
jgi:alpha-L-arabinofuranosidase